LTSNKTEVLCTTLEIFHMKKTLIALAALAAVGSASAQYTLYGKIDSVFQVKNTNSGVLNESDLTVVGLNSGGLSGSRWGLKGSEDLGNGLKASFQLENGFGSDTGLIGQNGGIFSRQAWVALGGSFGTVSLGRQYSAFDSVMGNYDGQGYSGQSAMDYAWNNVNGVNADVARYNNMIQYALPKMGGLELAVQFAPGEDNDNNGRKAGNYTSIYGTYTAGALSVSAAYENATTTTARVAATPATAAETTVVLNGITYKATGLTTVAVAAADTTSKDNSNVSLGGSYDIGVAKLFAGWEQGSVTGGQDNGFTLGVSMPAGAFNIGASYARERLSRDGMNDGEATAFGGQAVYNLSKRTNIYGAYLSGKTYAAYTSALGKGFEAKATTYSVGIRHDF
jgi:predicted porin